MIEPGDLSIGNLSPIGIDGGSIEIDRYLPGRPADRIGASDRGLTLLRVTADRRNGQTCYQAGDSRRYNPVLEHGCVHITMRRSIPKPRLPEKRGAHSTHLRAGDSFA